MEFYSTEDVKCLKEILDSTLSDDVYFELPLNYTLEDLNNLFAEKIIWY